MEESAKKKVKLDPAITRDLWSGDEKTVLKALMMLRTGGSIYYIPELLRLLNDTRAEPIEKELVRFLADVKDKAAVPFIVSGLRNPELNSARWKIVSACWQSGLDFSPEIDLFSKLFLEGDYQTALESFTVIEESALNLNPGEIAKLRDTILGGMKTLSEEKKPLARELVKILED
jgi:hypothetical protein